MGITYEKSKLKNLNVHNCAHSHNSASSFTYYYDFYGKYGWTKNIWILMLGLTI